MTKRLIALLLSLIMVFACLVGCGKEDDTIEDIENEASASAMTFSMYLMSEEKVSDEQKAAVEAAVNSITQSKFKTKLVLHFYTEDEYYTALEEAFASSANADEFEQNLGNALKGEDESETAEETYVDEYGVVQIKYPDIADNQVDIFYLGGYDRLLQYIENSMVADLSDEVTSASKMINTYVHSGYMESMDALCGGTYAVPTNSPIGEYTYILLNKEILKEYNHIPSDFDSILGSNSQQLLDLVSKYNKDYVPLRTFTNDDRLDFSHIRYFGINADGKFSDSDFSLLGGYYEPTWEYLVEGQFTRCASVFNDSTFISQLQTLVKYKENNYYGTDADADKKFAMGYIKGGTEVIEQYGDEYEIVVHQNPVLNTMDAFENMFAVNANTEDVARCMQIVTYLITNSDFRNTLLYGVEGEHYELVESDMLDKNGKPYMRVKRNESNLYMMAPEKTGNVLLALPTVDQAPNLRDIYQKQNLDASVNLILGMTHNYADMVLSFDHTDYLRDVSERVYSELLAIEKIDGEGGLTEYITNIRKEINTDETLVAAMRQGTIADPEGGDPLETIPTVYMKWILDNDMTLEDDDIR